MTENKRFKLYEHKDNDYILDNPNEHLDFIEMLGDALTSEEIVDLLNEQEEYQQKVKETLQKRYAQLDRITKRYGDMHKPCKDLLEAICKELGVEIDD